MSANGNAQAQAEALRANAAAAAGAAGTGRAAAGAAGAGRAAASAVPGATAPSSAAAAGAAPTPMLAARGVRFSWGSHEVLRGIDLAVDVGSVCCLMGRNGCGKSTFLDCVLGENHPSAGSIELAGRDAFAMNARERAELVAYVPQIHENTFPYTIERIVAMGRTVHQGAFGAPDATDDELVAEALETCGIAHLAQRPCTEVSGGEMQMALLARALVQRTPLIVLDEPTAHLDFRNELVFLEAVERLARELNTTVLMATHAPNQAFHLQNAGLAVNVALMCAGGITAFGPPDRVLVHDALVRCFGVDAFVADIDLGAAGDPSAQGGSSDIRQIVPLRSTRQEGCNDGYAN